MIVPTADALLRMGFAGIAAVHLWNWPGFGLLRLNSSLHILLRHSVGPRESLSMRSAHITLMLSAVAGLAGCQESSPTAAPATTTAAADNVEHAHADHPESESATVAAAAADTTEHDHTAADSEHDHEMALGHGPGMGMGRGMGPGRGMGMGSGRGMGMGPGRGMGMGMGPGRGMGQGGAGAAGGMQSDMSTIHGMFADRTKIRRVVKMLPDGAEALTESDDKDLVAFIQDHVPNMDSRVLENQPLPPMTFHPVFTALIRHADDYTLSYDETKQGVKVTYQSDDPYVVMLVQEHAKLVSRFILNGRDEIHADYELPEYSEEIAAARRKAIIARDALFASLSGRLTEVMGNQGPAAAISVCSREAALIARKISADHGLRIGRTAIRLRNPQNAPPEWVRPLLETAPTEAQFVSVADNTLGALLPIRLQQKCLACHGPTDSLRDDVREQLSAFYPDDAATGYAEGDVRGWFWVESPLEQSDPGQQN